MNLFGTVDIPYNAILTSKPSLTLRSQNNFFFSFLVIELVLKMLNFFRSFQSEQKDQTEGMI